MSKPQLRGAIDDLLVVRRAATTRREEELAARVRELEAVTDQLAAAAREVERARSRLGARDLEQSRELARGMSGRDAALGARFRERLAKAVDDADAKLTANRELVSRAEEAVTNARGALSLAKAEEDLVRRRVETREEDARREAEGRAEDDADAMTRNGENTAHALASRTRPRKDDAP